MLLKHSEFSEGSMSLRVPCTEPRYNGVDSGLLVEFPGQGDSGYLKIKDHLYTNFIDSKIVDYHLLLFDLGRFQLLDECLLFGLEWRY
jgi:hypothetical protein